MVLAHRHYTGNAAAKRRGSRPALAPWWLATKPPGLPQFAYRGEAVVSFAITAMARPLLPTQLSRDPIERQCPIRVVSVHLIGTTGHLLRVLFLDRVGHISSQPHYVHRGEALILASNQHRCSGPRPGCRWSEAQAHHWGSGRRVAQPGPSSGEA
ncbi:hypothetical protein KQ306_08925 [Synechococcus sp. CS-1324]|uniref:hypothetical protein n=1 Tax=Synechococcus sp. CS-1324 TaxID=2847980 RepID=UPI00223C3AA8|nr:hypothetical protein [Synechococcus sp. CS-1324]MCT0230970.1 hypothetical protein [Synechococcus sp. CS-1324]